MSLKTLFDAWVTKAATASRYNPLEFIKSDDLAVLYSYNFRLLCLTFEKLAVLTSSTSMRTTATNNQITMCKNIARQVMCHEIVQGHFFDILFVKVVKNQNKTLYDLMHDLSALQWIPSDGLDPVMEVFNANGNPLTIHAFCEQPFIKDLNTAVASDAIIPERKFQYGSSPIVFYQNHSGFSQQYISIPKIQRSVKREMVIKRAIDDKCRKENVVSTELLNVTATDLLTDDKFNNSPLSNHGNLFFSWLGHGNTNTVQTIFRQTKKDLIHNAIMQVHTPEGFEAAGAALKALLKEGSDERKIIRRPMDKMDYSGWGTHDADTKSFKLITAAIEKLYAGSEMIVGDAVKLNANEPYLRLDQEDALNALAEHINLASNIFSIGRITHKLTPKTT